MAALVVGSLRTPDGWGLDNYANLATTGSGGALEVTVWQAALNSLRIAVDATWIAMVVGVLDLRGAVASAAALDGRRRSGCSTACSCCRSASRR